MVFVRKVFAPGPGTGLKATFRWRPIQSARGRVSSTLSGSLFFIPPPLVEVMIFTGRSRRGFLDFKKNRSPILWIGLAVLLSAIALMLVFFMGGTGQKPGQIPSEVLAKIEQEMTKARQDHAEFLKTPAGQLWQRYPYWTPEICQKIVEGRVFPGMSKEQAREAVGRVMEVRKKKGDQQSEEWAVESRNREKLFLRFEGNALAEVEGKKE
jgi:hypothetical protein